MKKMMMGILLLIQSSAMAADSYSLEKYIEEVRSKNMAVRAAQLASEGGQERREEYKMQYWPTLNLGFETKTDEREANASTFAGSKQEYTTTSLALAQRTGIGLNGTFSYSLIDTHLVGSSLSPAAFNVGNAQIDLTQSLWRNGLGREFSASVALSKAKADAEYFSDTFTFKKLIADAELAYWRLAIARGVLGFQKEILDRAKSIRGWSAKRAGMKLADASDLYQADAAVAGRELEFKQATEEELSARRAFNTVRGVKSDDVAEKLNEPEAKYLLELAVKVSSEPREDLSALEAQSRLAEAQYQLALEANKPTLDIYATYAQGGKEVSSSDAIDESMKGDFPYTVLGVKFSTPLDFSAAASARQGSRLQKEAAQMKYRQTELEQIRLKEDFQVKLGQARDRLKLVQNLEAAQEKKLKHERDRLNKGRSTTYQVLLFEQDYLNSQLLLARTQNEILGLLAQLKTYGENK